MNELELLKKLKKLESIANDLEIRIKIWDNKKEQEQFIVEYENTNTEIKIVTNQLFEIEDKKFSIEARSAMIKQLNYYVTEINKAKPYLNLSRNQGLSLKNVLFSEIVGDLNYLISNKIAGIHIPSYLKYTIEPEDSVSIPELTEFLRAEILNLRNTLNPNFIKLRKYLDGFTERIVEKFIE